MTEEAGRAAPLARKLGIRPGDIVGLLGAPAGFERVLGNLPQGVVIRRGARGRCAPVIWFVRTVRQLERELKKVAGKAGDVAESRLWIAWRKGGAPPGENAVRRAGLSIGLVDIKVCAIDSTWSGLFFVRRRL